MTTVPKQLEKPRTAGVQLKTSKYDQVSSLLVALLILIGLAVTILFIIWLTLTLVFRPPPVPITLVENIAGRGDHAEGFERDLEAPGMEEMPELAEPQLETALEAVTDAVSSVAASMDVLDTPSTETSKGEGGRGDNRPPGPLGEGDNIIPRWERWEIRWNSTGISTYAKQLDYFKIELGAAGGKQFVEFAYNLSKGRPDSKQTPPAHADAKRLYFTWKGGTLQQFDRTLLQKAGIQTAGRLVMQFFPKVVEDRLAWIEHENAKGRSVKEFYKTVFGVRKKGNAFEFHVVEQRFRPAPP